VVDVTDNWQNRAERSLWPLQNDTHVPNFEQSKCFTNVRPQRLGYDKMQYLETTTDAAFEILKDKFQYVSDQLELISKQHRAVKGRFVSYLQEHVVRFNSPCYDIHWRKRTCWNTCFCLVLLKQDKRSEGYGMRRAEWVSSLSSVDMFCCDSSRVCTVIKWCSSEADVNICLSD